MHRGRFVGHATFFFSVVIVFLSIFAEGCLKKAIVDDSKVSTQTALVSDVNWLFPKDTAAYAFSWTDDPSLTQQNASEKLKAQFASAAAWNRTAERTPEMENGAGLYVSGDPIASSDYGRKLIMAPLARNLQNRIAIDSGRDPEQWRSLVRDEKISGIFYSFGGLFFVKGGGNAIVIRNESIIDMNRIEIVDLSKTFGTPWKDLVLAADILPQESSRILKICGGNTFLFQTLDKSNFIFTGKPDRPISNLGILLGLRSELSFPSPSLAQEIMKRKDDNAFPNARDRLNFFSMNPRLNTDAYRMTLYFDDVFNRVISEMYDKNPQFDSGSSSLTVDEAVRFLVLVKMLEQSAKPTTFKALGQALVDRFNSTPGAYKNLSDAYILAKKMQDYWSRNSFSTWYSFR